MKGGRETSSPLVSTLLLAPLNGRGSLSNLRRKTRARAEAFRPLSP